MDNLQSYKLKILNKEYSISSSDSKEHIIRVAELLEQKLKEFLSLNPSSSLETAGVIISMQLLEELVNLQNESNRIIKNIVNEKQD